MFKKFKNKINCMIIGVKSVICNKKAEGFVDSGVKILIAIVIGTLLMSGLFLLYNDVILPTLGEKIQGLFNYKA